MKMHIGINLIGGLAAVLLSACGQSGPSREEANQLREKRVEAALHKQQENLEAFAKKYSAIPVQPFVYGSSWGRMYTAEIQRQFENKPIAFKAVLLDVVMNKAGEYEAVFGQYVPNATTFNLSLNTDQYNQMIKTHRGRVITYNVAANVSRIQPVNLQAKVCSEPGCNQVEISGNPFGRSYQISGTLLGCEAVSEP